VQQDKGTPDVIAVQIAHVEAIVGSDRSTVAAANAQEAADTIKANPGLEVLDESASRLGGLTGFNLEVDNASGSHAPILEVPVGRLGIDSGRRLWISLFDTDDGLLAVMVGGSIAQWDRALALAEPVLESIVIGGSTRPDAADGQRYEDKGPTWAAGPCLFLCRPAPAPPGAPDRARTIRSSVESCLPEIWHLAGISRIIGGWRVGISPRTTCSLRSTSLHREPGGVAGAVPLPRGEVLARPGQPFEYAYFPFSGMISVVALMPEGLGRGRHGRQ
jgi:hypothetical protein